MLSPMFVAQYLWENGEIYQHEPVGDSFSINTSADDVTTISLYRDGKLVLGLGRPSKGCKQLIKVVMR